MGLLVAATAPRMDVLVAGRFLLSALLLAPLARREAVTVSVRLRRRDVALAVAIVSRPLPPALPSLSFVETYRFGFVSTTV